MCLTAMYSPFTKITRILTFRHYLWSSLRAIASWEAQTVKNLTATQGTWVRSLGREDPLEKEMATHSRILAWRIPWTKEPGGLRSTDSQSWIGQSN